MRLLCDENLEDEFIAAAAPGNALDGLILYPPDFALAGAQALRASRRDMAEAV